MNQKYNNTLLSGKIRGLGFQIHNTVFLALRSAVLGFLSLADTNNSFFLILQNINVLKKNNV